jgi:hypothetical protein
MIKSALTKIRTHLIFTAAAVVCVMVAVVALGFTVYAALALVVIPVAAAALTALIFFLLAAGSMAVLLIEPRKPKVEEPPVRSGIWSAVEWSRLAPIASEVGLAVTAILADRARRRRDDRGRDRR